MVESGLPQWLVERAHAEFELLGLGRLDPNEPPYGDSDFAHVEHMLHEVAHALTLDLPLQHGVAADITATIKALPKVEQCENEARAWAIVWLVGLRLRLPMVLDEIYDGAVIQGCTEKQVRRALVDPENARVAASVLAFLGFA